ncbi:hypothetical protein [Actinopolymorpha pittospori]|uniref:Heme/copper-type cytochrome/quinol oxidase subunit 2 n=1 Tax=Actinopolymorpha pittospori TaxID=648752 RepID=A0A927RBE8_9ACTN|nr:hypothetical protein [Actinopolymorpha pittospori]MBE1610067.1 heme/copper-type cytochrome/quinol oxidase subunit 2 [Actinopolymorpha pittospori]
MLHLAVTLYTLGVRLADQARTKLTTEPERGSETIEKVLWAVAVIAIVAIVVTVIKNYVTSEAGKIK